ncbi:hypothetical protein KSF_112770 [Reticulibacter mediterranei]|uniref:Transposase DDE domain-containing protein n=1 Tax=Reticulibacter mediterranei TaxID=2778369 RepID=A0A8J3N7H9_9CHLR|nr:hypothetical protein KSF_074520 [Reticulibacter mediterranei]GHP01230.1 hypothetical protein KSF_112770 [Reticulibacter mediterranei]
MIPMCRLWTAGRHPSAILRAPWCVRFRGEARYGKDHADRQTFYGFRLHAQLSWPGVFTRLCLAPANEADGTMAPLLLEGITGVVLGDCNYWLPDLQAFLRSKGMLLQAPFRKAHSPKAVAYQSCVLGRGRYLIDAAFVSSCNHLLAIIIVATRFPFLFASIAISACNCLLEGCK